MQYLIDGYNLLFRLHAGKGESLEKKRESLVSILNQELSTLKGPITIIFDSSEEIHDFARSAKLPNLDVVYAPKGKTADEYIIELVEQHKNPKILTLVSSDEGLARQCQHLGARTQSIEDFLIFVVKKHKTPSKEKPNYKESSTEMERLIKIFEERLKRN